MPVIFIPLEALFFLNPQLEILSFTPLGSKYFLRRYFFEFYQLQTLLMSATVFTKENRFQAL
jgi:hypothetical protein